MNVGVVWDFKVYTSEFGPEYLPKHFFSSILFVKLHGWIPNDILNQL